MIVVVIFGSMCLMVSGMVLFLLLIIWYIFSVDMWLILVEVVFEFLVIIFLSCIGGDFIIYD